MRGEKRRPTRSKAANRARVCPPVSVVCSAMGRSVLAKLVQAGPAVGGDAGQLAQFGPKRRPAVDGQEIAGRIGVTPGTLHPHIPRAQGVSEYVENYQFPVVAVGRPVTVPGGFQVLTPPGGHEVAGGVVGHPPSSAGVQVLQDLDGLQQPGRLRAPAQGQGGQHARGELPQAGVAGLQQRQMPGVAAGPARRANGPFAACPCRSGPAADRPRPHQAPRGRPAPPAARPEAPPGAGHLWPAAPAAHPAGYGLGSRRWKGPGRRATPARRGSRRPPRPWWPTASGSGAEDRSGQAPEPSSDAPPEQGTAAGPGAAPTGRGCRRQGPQVGQLVQLDLDDLGGGGGGAPAQPRQPAHAEVGVGHQQVVQLLPAALGAVDRAQAHGGGDLCALTGGGRPALQALHAGSDHPGRPQVLTAQADQ